MPKTVAGIDYSLVSPAICCYSTASGYFMFESCDFYVLSNKKKLLESYADGKLPDNIHVDKYPDYLTDIERYGKLAKWASKVLTEIYDPQAVRLEGYAFSSTGMVFNIAEAGGILKYYMWKNSIPFSVVAPSTLKKFATGKGNATKKTMLNVFQNEFMENTIDLKDVLLETEKQNNPSSDIVDSYFLAHLAYKELWS